jgi:2-polyprenyl-3-methyl-5-hydroxy-6-metoxy-1,4-benzoquinol methylase
LFLVNRFCKEQQTISFVGGNRRVLEIGCANGRMSRFLTERGCDVTGVELDPELSRQAATVCRRVITGSIEVPETLPADEQFDVVLLADVLEHLAWPDRVLHRLGKSLAPGGALVIAIPNAAFWTMRLRLLLGRFDYSPNGGMLDRGHLRFFTRRSILRLLRECGFRIETVYAAPFLLRGERLSKVPFMKWVLWLFNGLIPAAIARLFPGAMAYAFVIRATLDGPQR